jgi:hypothetical protein
VPDAATQVRTTEGAFGHLTTYVVPTVSPKTCQSITHQLKTLSLHIRVPGASDRPADSLTVQCGEAWVLSVCLSVTQPLHAGGLLPREA